jgi:hypothetical protein
MLRTWGKIFIKVGFSTEAARKGIVPEISVNAEYYEGSVTTLMLWIDGKD